MLRWFLRRKLDSEERRLGASMDYLRHVLGVSRGVFLRFASIMPFANSRKTLPVDAWYTAQLVSLQREDCGPCLQIAVNLARDDGMRPELIEAVLKGDPGFLSVELEDVYNFTHVIVNDLDHNPGELREIIRERHGERGLIELSYAIAGSRIPPTVKRVLGYAQSCRHVQIEVAD